MVACGLYYKHMTIVNEDSGVVIKWSFKLIDAARGVTYDHHMFIVQALSLTLKTSTLDWKIFKVVNGLAYFVDAAKTQKKFL